MIRRFAPPFAAALLACGFPSVRAAEESAGLRATLDRYCVDCHGEFYAENDLRLDAAALDVTAADAETAAALLKAHDRLKAGEMPPPDQVEPSGLPGDAERGHAVAALAGVLHEADAARQREDGRTRLRRLSRTEYAHAVRDLLRVDTAVGALLPGDGVAHGFDKTVDALGTSSVLIDAYVEAAAAAVGDAAALGPRPELTTERHSYLTGEEYARMRDPDSKIFLPLEDAMAIFSSNYCPTELRSYRCETPGRYRVKVSAYAHRRDPAAAEPVVFRGYHGWLGRAGMELSGHFAAAPKPADAPADWEPEPVEFGVTLGEGATFKFVPYDIGYDVWREGAANSSESALAIRWVEITGPLIEQWPPPSYRALFGDLPTELTNADEVARRKRTKPRYAVVTDAPAEDAERLLSALATRAFRRPLAEGELAGLFALLRDRLEAGASFEDVMKLGATAILCDPAFLTVGGESGRAVVAEGALSERIPEEEKPAALGPHALASRLSFMLWSSVPDAELRSHADAGTLGDPAVFRAQAERLLADPKHERFSRDFVDQWLDLAWLDASTPDPELAPEFDDVLRPSMEEETRRTFEFMLTRDRPVREVADADWAILNARLARHYGLDPAALGLGPVGFERVDLPADSVRGGFVTQASIAKVTANGTHTSPVLRGQFVMDAIVGSPIPPPPPNVPAVEPDVRGAETIREKLAAHRAAPECAGCHRKMDPAGFALESLDVVGTFRDRYRVPKGADGEVVKETVGNRRVTYFTALPVDCADALPDGRAFTSLREFKRLLASDERQLARSLAEKWLTYGTGEGLSFADRRDVEAILDEVEPSGYGVRTLLLATVCSDAFARR